MIPKLEIMCGLNVDKRAIDELAELGNSIRSAQLRMCQLNTVDAKVQDEFGSFTLHEYKSVINMMDMRDRFKILDLNDSPKSSKPSNLFLGLMSRLEL